MAKTKTRSHGSTARGPCEIPVIDLFAGPGGLGEGFSSLPDANGQRAFKIRLSVEKDAVAHETLELRAFFRQFQPGAAPEDYYRFVRGEISRQDLFAAHPAQGQAARTEAWHCELGIQNASAVRERIGMALQGAKRWVLIGGPPCQAYSLAGRSRNAGKKDYDFATDPRQRLYVDYLQVIADHGPAIFVMENVKGLLSARIENTRIFEKILVDLQSPYGALQSEGRSVAPGNRPGYRLYSLSPLRAELMPTVPLPKDFLIRAEQHGVPQARHRLILVGIRDDIRQFPAALHPEPPVPVRSVLGGLPPLRSGISGGADGCEEWIALLRAGTDRRWLKTAGSSGGRRDEVYRLLLRSMLSAHAPRDGRGGEFIYAPVDVQYRSDWYLDQRMGGVCNHSTRAHMASDLYRYLFSACFAKVYERTPTLADFPPDLLPDHQNVDQAISTGHFSDRFRVQLPDRPSTTITSHISKDGHYYIHYDPDQCRSLTVREAARLQTFPDNYFFCGGRTAQYTQVGNAVPPLLAHQIAEIVRDLLG
jgi:DNA (cytosine-5)-methyltransferase 1